MNGNSDFEALERIISKKRLKKADLLYCRELIVRIQRSLFENKIQTDCVLNNKISILKNADTKAREIIENAKTKAQSIVNRAQSVDETRRKCAEIEQNAYKKCESIVTSAKEYLTGLSLQTISCLQQGITDIEHHLQKINGTDEFRG